jgi:hypothetical protein
VTKKMYPPDSHARDQFFPTQQSNTIIAAVMNVLVDPNDNLPHRDDEGPEFEHLLRQIDNDQDRDFNGMVRFGRNSILSDRGAQRLGQSLLGAAHRRRFISIIISPYYMTADADRYSALLDFLATGQYHNIRLHQEAAWPAPSPGMLAAMERIVIAMVANQAQAQLSITGVSLTMRLLHLALQRPHTTTLTRCRMESRSPLEQLLALPDDTADRDDSFHFLRLTSSNDWSGILKAATTSKIPNVTNLRLDFDVPIAGPLDLSSVIGFVAAQSNSVDLVLTYQSNQNDEVAITEQIVADISTQCPGVRRLAIRIDDAQAWVFCQLFPRLTELVSNSALMRLAIEDPSEYSVLSPEQEQQVSVITVRNSVIPVYLETTHLLKQLSGPWAMHPFTYDKRIDGKDHRKHQYLLSHALSQAAVHPIFFSHVYEFIRQHVDQLFGGGPEGRRQRQQDQDDNGSTLIEL